MGPRATTQGMQEVVIRGDVLRLGQLLKLADVAASGGEAKALLGTGAVAVNGKPELRRGRQLRDGDVVTVEDRVLRIVVQAP